MATPSAISAIRALSIRSRRATPMPHQTTSTARVGGSPSKRTSARPTKHDDETVDLLTLILTDFEKNAWFLRATLA
jgi:DNA-binding ferritin-like protein